MPLANGFEKLRLNWQHLLNSSYPGDQLKEYITSIRNCYRCVQQQFAICDAPVSKAMLKVGSWKSLSSSDEEQVSPEASDEYCGNCNKGLGNVSDFF